ISRRIVVKVAHHPRRLPRTRGCILGYAATLGAGRSCRRRKHFGAFSSFGCVVEVSGLRNCGRPAGTGILLWRLRGPFQGARSRTCPPRRARIQFCYGGKQVLDTDRQSSCASFASKVNAILGLVLEARASSPVPLGLSTRLTRTAQPPPSLLLNPRTALPAFLRCARQ